MSDQPQACRLCGQVRALCRSHIVPELAYEPIKNDKDQIYALGPTTKKVQTGYFEKLLCQECEALLSRYENSFKQVWMDTIPPEFGHLRTRPLTDLISVDVPDYTRFKLFHLSVFWRAAVSTGFKTDPKVSFGPYSDEIAGLITAGDPGQPGDFPFFGILNLDDQRRPLPTVSHLAEGKGRCEGHRYYLMSYAYCDWIFLLARPGPQWLRELETKYRREHMFLLLTVPYRQSKSFNLSVRTLRQLRQ